MGKRSLPPESKHKEPPPCFPPVAIAGAAERDASRHRDAPLASWSVWLKLAGAAALAGFLVWGVMALSALTQGQSNSQPHRRGLVPAQKDLLPRDDTNSSSPNPSPQSTTSSGPEAGRCGTTPTSRLLKRDGFGSCAKGSKPCCSEWGWCGSAEVHCGTGCQREYSNLGENGIICDPFSRFRQDSEVKKSAVPFSTPIYHCNLPGTIALTFDDGPYDYTSGLLDLLKEYNAKATFMITGNNLDWTNKGVIDDPSKPWPDLIRRIDAENHQIGSHVWQHKDLSVLAAEEVKDELVSLEVALKNILGKIPTYMRPPYSSCAESSYCPQILADFQYHQILFDVDSADWIYYQSSTVSMAEAAFKKALNVRAENRGDEGSPGGNALVIAHDIHNSSSTTLAKTMLEEGQKLGWKFVTVGECLGDDSKFWYKQIS